jgi:peroxiredoxin
MKAFPFALVAVSLLAAPAFAEPEIGKAAPAFRANDINGRVVSLSDFKGKTVVLEWTNPECPFVRKHYGSGNMQKTQAAAMKAGVVWLSINSSAPGKQGNLDSASAKTAFAAQKAQPTAYLLDPNGVIGNGYGAKTTPHMYIVDAKGTLVYNGGIDDKPTPNPADIDGARNHVLAALGELKARKPISVPTSKPYGCNVKYKDS